MKFEVRPIICKVLYLSAVLFLLSFETFAQNIEVKSLYDEVDRVMQVCSGDKIEINVGEKLGIYTDTDDMVDRYDSMFEGAYFNAAYVYFSDGTANANPNSKYIHINHRDPKSDFNIITGVKPTSGYIDMKIYYVIAYYDRKGITRVASFEYPFKVKVVGKGAQEPAALKQVSLPKEITVNQYYDYLLIPQLKPAGAISEFSWKSSDQSVAVALSGTVALEPSVYNSKYLDRFISEEDCCVRAIDVGSAVISVETEEGLTASVKVNVKKPKVHAADANDVMSDIYKMVMRTLNR